MKPITSIKDVFIHTLISSVMFAFVMWLVLFIRCDVTYADKKISTPALFGVIMLCYFVMMFIFGLFEWAVNTNKKFTKYGKLENLGKGKKL